MRGKKCILSGQNVLGKYACDFFIGEDGLLGLTSANHIEAIVTRDGAEKFELSQGGIKLKLKLNFL